MAGNALAPTVRTLIGQSKIKGGRRDMCYNWWLMKLKKGLITLTLLMLCLLLIGCTPPPNFDSRLGSILKPYRFSLVKWEGGAIPHEIGQWFSQAKGGDDETHVVTEYFAVIERIKTLESEIRAINDGNKQGDLALLEAELTTLHNYKIAVKDVVERIIERQTKQALAEQGVFNPLDRYIMVRVNFPPLNFKLEEPPHLLVISPRDRIASIRRIYLQQRIDLKEIEDTEAEVDKLGVSSLVVELGGLAMTYPSFVTDDGSLEFTIRAATEEWLHQYLVFKPLGVLYLLDQLGISRNYEVVTMNETVTSMISKEISAIVVETYYPEYEDVNNINQKKDTEFDFNQEMQKIRRAVDNYLARGEIEQAEQFMEDMRQYLASKGHHIRKLNQAYFAFHGVYADSPTSVDPIGLELKELRSRTTSLREFLNTVAVMTSRQDLKQSIE